MFDLTRVQQDFASAAAAYDVHAGLQQHVLASLLARAKPSGRILDAGCGTGRLARLLEGQDVVQLDIAEAMCRKATESGQSAINGRIETLPFADRSFDAVCSSLVLQWLPNVPEVLSELRRVLKPGGMLALSTFGAATLKELKESFSAVDRYEHVSDFPGIPDAVSEIITEHYPDLLALTRQIKQIGARNKLLCRRKSLMTHGQMVKVEENYRDRFGTMQGLPVTWEILYSVTQKS